MQFWTIWALYIVIGCILKAIWFVLKWTFFLVPTVVVLIMKVMIPLIFKVILFIMCLPFVLLYALFSKKN